MSSNICHSETNIIRIYHVCEGWIEKNLSRGSPSCITRLTKWCQMLIVKERFFYPILTKIIDSFFCSTLIQCVQKAMQTVHNVWLLAPYQRKAFQICRILRFYCLVLCFTSLSTAMVMSGWPVHLTTLFSWVSLIKQLTSTSFQKFAHILLLVTDNYPSWINGREKNGRRNYFMINLSESMKPCEI